MDKKNFLLTDLNGFLSFHIKVFLKITYKDCNFYHIDLRKLKNENYKPIDTIYYTGYDNRGDDLIMKNEESFHNFTRFYALNNIRTKSLIFINSVKVFTDKSSKFSISKKSISEKLLNFCKNNKIVYYDLHFPNLFGEFGKPFSNSFISSCCKNIIDQEDSIPNLLNNYTNYYYVADVVRLIKDPLNFDRKIKNINFLSFSPKELIDVLNNFYKSYFLHKTLPKFKSLLYLKLFNTLRSFRDPNDLLISSKSFSDNRGILVENYNYNGVASNFISTTLPLIERGNHFHMFKFERFRFYNGITDIYLRKIFTKKIIKYTIKNNLMLYIDIPTYYTHKLVNNSSNESLGIFTSIPRYNKNKPDTYYESVL